MEVLTVQETCCFEGCGIVFWLEQKYQKGLVSLKRSFYCPNGHPQSYSGESDAAKLIRLRDEKDILERAKNFEIKVLNKKLRKYQKNNKNK